MLISLHFSVLKAAASNRLYIKITWTTSMRSNKQQLQRYGIYASVTWKFYALLVTRKTCSHDTASNFWSKASFWCDQKQKKEKISQLNWSCIDSVRLRSNDYDIGYYALRQKYHRSRWRSLWIDQKGFSQRLHRSVVTQCKIVLLPSASWLRQGNVFTPVCDSVHRGGGLADTPPPPPEDTPRADDPLPLPRKTPLGQMTPSPRADPSPGQTPPRRRPQQRTVRIPLECMFLFTLAVCDGVCDSSFAHTKYPMVQHTFFGSKLHKTPKKILPLDNLTMEELNLGNLKV